MNYDDKYTVFIRNNETGEINDITSDSTLIKEYDNSERWEAAGIKMLCMYIGLTGTSQSKFMAFVLKTKNADNILLGSNAKLAENSKISISTVKKVKAKLIKSGFLRKVQVGVHMVDPKLLSYGGKTRHRVLLSIWNKS